MKHVYFNSYPTAHKEINTDQSLNIQCMKDFDEAIQMAGLIRTTEPDQLDLDNVPNIILVDHRKTNTGFYDIAYEYQPLIYTSMKLHTIFTLLSLLFLTLSCHKSDLKC